MLTQKRLMIITQNSRRVVLNLLMRINFTTFFHLMTFKSIKINTSMLIGHMIPPSAKCLEKMTILTFPCAEKTI